MIHLLIVSFIWAFSFGLIKGHLTGLDSNFVAFSRMLLSFLVFAPFLRIRGIPLKLALQFMSIGTFQFGVMYVTYIYSYRFLLAHQVALYTIFTPLYVTGINDLLDRRFRPKFFLTSFLAIIGAYIIVQAEAHRFEVRAGFLILQVSNLCFACGQVFYKRIMNKHPEIKDRHIFGYLYLGALAVTALFAGVTTDWKNITLTAQQAGTLLYLGLLASGLCFFLWNFGAKKTPTGTLAIMNNLKIPLAVACSMIFFHEEGDLGRLLAGGGVLVAALFLNEFLAGNPFRNPGSQDPAKPLGDEKNHS